jgi:XTP/dITP diphosphohydrolase
MTRPAPRRRLLAATHNPGKAAELARLLAGAPFDLVAPRDIGLELDPEETGETFEENASAKAIAFAEASGLPTLADDSGLEVHALDGRPGVRSARYAGEPRDDARNLARLLAELDAVPDPRRTARFVCVVALAVPPGVPPVAGTPPGSVRLFRGTCEGRIGREPRGTGGFGYDPVFFPAGTAETFAEMPADRKDGFSHRGRAVAAAVAALRAG